MHQFTFRQVFIATGSLALFSIVIFWSFNELSELFGGPEAQFKHAIAALGILLTIKWTVTRFQGRHERISTRNRHPRRSREHLRDH